VRLLADSPVEVLDALSQVTRTLTLALTLTLTLTPTLTLSYTLTLLDALRQAVGRYHPHSYTGGGPVPPPFLHRRWAGTTPILTQAVGRYVGCTSQAGEIREYRDAQGKVLAFVRVGVRVRA